MRLEPNPTQKRLLALDGGGLMGCITIGILAQVEHQLRKIYADDTFVLGNFFDYIGGTSTGAIIATALRMGRPVADIRDFYRDQGARMFRPASLLRRVRSGLSHKFDHQELARMLEQEFTGKTILKLQDEGCLPTDKHLLIVTRNVNTDSSWPLSTNPEAKYNKREHEMCNREIPLWQVVRASTAAPSFFQPEHVTFKNGKVYTLVDGGLTPHNNPALKLYQMATREEYACRWTASEDKMMLLSIGTGLAAREVTRPSKAGQWLLGLAKSVPSDLMRGASIENDVTCRTIGRCRYGPSIDRELEDLTNDPNGPRAFTYVRYDADISPGSLETAGIALPGGAPKMDNIQEIDGFLKIGEKAADQAKIEEHFGAFLP